MTVCVVSRSSKNCVLNQPASWNGTKGGQVEPYAQNVILLSEFPSWASSAPSVKWVGRDPRAPQGHSALAQISAHASLPEKWASSFPVGPFEFRPQL